MVFQCSIGTLRESPKKIIYLQLTLTLILVSSFCLCPNALFHTVHRYVASLSSQQRLAHFHGVIIHQHMRPYPSVYGSKALIYCNVYWMSVKISLTTEPIGVLLKFSFKKLQGLLKAILFSYLNNGMVLGQYAAQNNKH